MCRLDLRCLLCDYRLCFTELGSERLPVGLHGGVLSPLTLFENGQVVAFGDGGFQMNPTSMERARYRSVILRLFASLYYQCCRSSANLARWSEKP